MNFKQNNLNRMPKKNIRWAHDENKIRRKSKRNETSEKQRDLDNYTTMGNK